MKTEELLAGTVHRMPKDVKKLLLSEAATLKTWNSLTPLARNEWICWVESAKLIETRERRVDRVRSDLSKGKRRPCCWAGCFHRERNGT